MRDRRVLQQIRSFAIVGCLLFPADAGATQAMTTYRDPGLGFAVAHPSDFVVRAQDVAALPPSALRPEASVFFMNPVMASGGLAGREPPDLEVRVYAAKDAASLPAWLSSSRLFSADAVAAAEPYPVGGSNGLKVCRQDMLAPGCAIFLGHEGRIYQLTAISADGERMIDSFTLLSP